jgi:hypothetical protein
MERELKLIVCFDDSYHHQRTGFTSIKSGQLTRLKSSRYYGMIYDEIKRVLSSDRYYNIETPEAYIYDIEIKYYKGSESMQPFECEESQAISIGLNVKYRNTPLSHRDKIMNHIGTNIFLPKEKVKRRDKLIENILNPEE